MMYIYFDSDTLKTLYEGEEEQNDMGEVTHKETYPHGLTKIWVKRK